MAPHRINVFLGSPGGLEEERDIALKTVSRLNQIMRPLKIAFDLYRWEDDVPAAGRPQDIINPAVDECDVFVGVVYRRWGTPTGTAASGFEEEFNRVMQRRTAETSPPEVQLFFKQVDPEALADPGPQLLRVVAFKKERKSQGDVMYKDFADTAAWIEEFTMALVAVASKFVPTSELATLDSMREAISLGRDSISQVLGRARVFLEDRWRSASGTDAYFKHSRDQVIVGLNIFRPQAVQYRCTVTDPQGVTRSVPADGYRTVQGAAHVELVYPDDFGHNLLSSGNYIVDWHEPSQQGNDYYRLARDGFGVDAVNRTPA